MKRILKYRKKSSLKCFFTFQCNNKYDFQHKIKKKCTQILRPWTQSRIFDLLTFLSSASLSPPQHNHNHTSLTLRLLCFIYLRSILFSALNFVDFLRVEWIFSFHCGRSVCMLSLSTTVNIFMYIHIYSYEWSNFILVLFSLQFWFTFVFFYFFPLFH